MFEIVVKSWVPDRTRGVEPTPDSYVTSKFGLEFKAEILLNLLEAWQSSYIRLTSDLHLLVAFFMRTSLCTMLLGDM